MVCCEQVTVTETDSPAGMPCRYQRVDACGSCSIHGTPEHPAVCQSFQCAWIRGCGGDEVEHRPDQNGVMFSVSETPSGKFGFAMEYRKDALVTTARPMLLAFAAAIPYPIIVRSEWSKPPFDYGDAVVIKQSLWDRCRTHLAGNLMRYITMDVALFELRHGRRGV